MEALPGLPPAAFGRCGGEEKKRLREGYHVAMKDSGALRGRQGLPSQAELERALKADRGVRLF